MSDSFVHLHTHSSHSVRDSIARPDDLFAAAASGQSALAIITDHGNLSGLYVANKAAQVAVLLGYCGDEVVLIV